MSTHHRSTACVKRQYRQVAQVHQPDRRRVWYCTTNIQTPRVVAYSLADRCKGMANCTREGDAYRASSLRELLAKFGDFFSRRRPVRITRVAVQYELSGLQGVFEFFMTERNRLVVVIRADDVKLQRIVHKRSCVSASFSIRLFVFAGLSSVGSGSVLVKKQG
jgi:hypothetical protein